MEKMSKTRCTAVALALAALSATGASATPTPAGDLRITPAMTAPATPDQGATLFARRGADDPAGRERRGRGRDDGPNHA